MSKQSKRSSPASQIGHPDHYTAKGEIVPAIKPTSRTRRTNSLGKPRGSWTFLTNHGHVLSYLASHPQSTIQEIAEAVGITRRGVQKIIASLEADGYVVRSRKGRCNTYTVNLDLPMRHRMEQHVAVRNLLLALGHIPNNGIQHRNPNGLPDP